MTRSEVPLLTAAIAGLGALLLVPVPLFVVGPAVLLVCAAPALRSRVERVPFGLITVLALAAAAWAALQGHGTVGLGALLAWLQVHRVVRGGPGDDRVTVLLSAVMLVFAASRTLDVALALPIVAWAAAAPVALLGAGPPRAVAVAAFAVGIAAFLAMPRLATGPTVSAGPSLTGFDSEVALGDMAGLWEDPTPVVRVQADGPLPMPPRLRGAVLDTFDGRTWTARSERVPFEGRGEGDLRLFVVEESVVENVLLAPGVPVHVEIEGVRPVRDADGTLWIERPAVPLRYVVVARSDATETLSEADVERLTDLPDLDERVAGMAASLEGADPTALAEAVRARLAAEYVYTRTARDTNDEEPLVGFLFDRKRGHCEYFASAAAVLLRSRDVPARLVTGFAGGERSGDGWLFRRAHAHAWVEYHDGVGWRVLDATPGPRPPRPPAVALRIRDALGAAWADRVVGYDRGVQVAVLVGFGQGIERAMGVPPTPRPWLGWALVGAGAAGLLVVAVVLARRLLANLAGERVPRPTGRVAASHARAWRTLHRKGWRVPPALPPVAAARFVRQHAGDPAAPLERLAWLHYAVHYGGADDRALADEAAACERDAAAIPGP